MVTGVLYETSVFHIRHNGIVKTKKITENQSRTMTVAFMSRNKLLFK